MTPGQAPSRRPAGRRNAFEAAPAVLAYNQGRTQTAYQDGLCGADQSSAFPRGVKRPSIPLDRLRLDPPRPIPVYSVDDPETHISRKRELRCVAKTAAASHIRIRQGRIGAQRSPPQPEGCGTQLRFIASPLRSWPIGCKPKTRKERRFNHGPRRFTRDRNWNFSDCQPRRRLRFG